MTIWQVCTIILHLIIAPLTAGHALLYKRDPRAALGWVSVCIFFPIFGPFLYYLFGINRINSRASYLSSQDNSRKLFGFERSAGAIPTLKLNTPHEVPRQLHSIAYLSDSLVEMPLVHGNNVTLLKNGEEAYPTMLYEINHAQKSVYLMTYILETNNTGQQFIEALKKAEERGVIVSVIIDGLGEMYSFPRASKLLKKSGIKVTRFLPPSLWPPSLHINLRNHRKLLIIDDEIAFSGGMNIGDRHLVNSTNSNRTQDIHFKFNGPIVRQLHQLFSETLQFCSKENLPEFSGDLIPNGGNTCRVIADGPDENLDRIELVMIGAITSAKNSVRIITPYFLPSREMISALKIASMKGINIQILLPENNNLPYVQWATHNMLGELLSYGVKVSKQSKPFSHSKLFIIDDQYAMIGSANIDPRSLRLNFEIGVEIFSNEKLDSLIHYFSRAKINSKPYILKDLDDRPIFVRLRDALSWLFSPYL
jgi:cardiolipin synthase